MDLKQVFLVSLEAFSLRSLSQRLDHSQIHFQSEINTVFLWQQFSVEQKRIELCLLKENKSVTKEAIASNRLHQGGERSTFLPMSSFLSHFSFLNALLNNNHSFH